MAADPTTVTYADTNPVLNYNGEWSTDTWSNGLVNGTMHVTTDLTASVSFSFPVAATAFSIFVIEQNTGGHYSICVDCAPNPKAITTVDGPLSPTTNQNPPALLFKQEFDAPGMHTVVLSNLLDPTTKGNSSLLALASITLDVPQTAAVLAAPGTTTLLAPNTKVLASAAATPLRNGTTSASTKASSASTTRTASLSSSSPPSASDSSTTASTPTPPTALTSSPANSTPATAAIVGGALGALALVCALAVLVWWRHLRRRRRRPTPRVWVTPFIRLWGAPALPVPPVPPMLPTPPVSKRSGRSAEAGASPPASRRVGNGAGAGTAPPEDPIEADSELPPPYDEEVH
ncbi:hypothetical protein HYPSUDRAFT_212570 [Hypholoma sublateritium FD-334 SS-4]|uniref:Mid2 domain-containing protein n=1 Tax=Hypholoma sublateritium (strain FD-334 SS-4) TaxID=945553 RepID=A0A0D2MTS0_HYPSF|nr:hypothetical protein HYPSUDRAFT_212570 [Hypholoma sublateritium FD-334 SS-4]